MLRFSPLLLLAPLIAGCATDDTAYPSLAQRPAETIGFDEPATPPPAPIVADPALDARIAAAERTRAAAAEAFTAGATRAEALARAARGAAAGSERWLDAQTALAELDSLRSTHADTIGALEDLATARAQTLQPAYPGLERALEAARAAAGEQTKRIDTIGAMLAPA